MKIKHFFLLNIFQSTLQYEKKCVYVEYYLIRVIFLAKLTSFYQNFKI